MAPQKLTEYERRRLENIKRNGEMLASLKVHSKIDELSSASRRQRVQNKSYKVSPSKKSKLETPVVIRRSLRTRGMPPDASTAGGVKDYVDEILVKTSKSKPLPFEPGPNHFSMKDAYCSESSDQKLKEIILGVSIKSKLCNGSDSFQCPLRVSGSVDLGSLRLEPQNIARVVPGRIMVTRFFPSTAMTMIAVGNKHGNIGFWDVNAGKEDGDGIYLYRPHPGPISAIVVQPFSLSKVYSSCYEGFIRLMDVEKELFELVHSSNCPIISMSHQQSDTSSLYFSEGNGVFHSWDKREGKLSTSWNLHGYRINSIDFSSENTNLMATSSTDGTACIWDLRNINADDPKPMKTVYHDRAVHSAYFSPSGTCLATTSYDDKVGLLSGANFEYETMIYHYNQTGRWISSFRAIWGWDDSYLFIGNMRRGVDVISTAQRRNIATLQSPDISAIPCRFDAHPFKIGMLAGATSGGQVYVWTTC